MFKNLEDLQLKEASLSAKSDKYSQHGVLVDAINTHCFGFGIHDLGSSFGSQTPVPLFSNAQLDTLVAGQGNVGLAAFADDEDVVQPGQKA